METAQMTDFSQVFLGGFQENTSIFNLDFIEIINDCNSHGILKYLAEILFGDMQVVSNLFNRLNVRIILVEIF